jgi:hypothetical protein
MRWVNVRVWLPRIESGHALPGNLETVITLSLVYAAFGAAMALMHARPWWSPWVAFLLGTVLCILIRARSIPPNISLFFDVFLGHIFLSGAVASFVSFLLVSRLRSRSNTSLERTRGR